MEMIRTTSTVYDSVTGEVKTSVETEKHNMKNKSYITFKNRSSFAKVFSYSLPDFSNRSFMGNFFILIHRLERYTNIITVKHRKVLCSATQDDLLNILDISTPTLKRFLAEARSIGAIASIRVSNVVSYCINPAYAYNGRGIDPYLFRVFENNRAFVEAIDFNGIIDFNSKTGGDYIETIKKNFPDIYRSKFDKSSFGGLL